MSELYDETTLSTRAINVLGNYGIHTESQLRALLESASPKEIIAKKWHNFGRGSIAELKGYAAEKGIGEQTGWLGQAAIKGRAKQSASARNAMIRLRNHLDGAKEAAAALGLVLEEPRFTISTASAQRFMHTRD